MAIAQVTRGTASSWGIATSSDRLEGDFSDLRSPATSSVRTGILVSTIDGSGNYGIGLQAPGNISNEFILATRSRGRR